MKLTCAELNNEMWKSRNFLADVRPQDGKYLATCLIFRGNLSMHEVDDQVSKIHNKLNNDFVPWIPNPIKATVVTIPSDYSPMSSTFVANTTSLRGIFQRIAYQFAKMYKRRALLHW